MYTCTSNFDFSICNSVVQTPVVEYQNVIRNVPSIEYQTIPQVQYQTQTVARQVPIYAGGNNPVAETSWLNTGNSAPVYSGGSAPVYSGGSVPVYSGGPSPVFSGGSPQVLTGGSPQVVSGSSPVFSNSPLYPGSVGSAPVYAGGNSGGPTVVRGDGTYIV